MRIVLNLTSKGRRNFCQAKTARFREIFTYRTPYFSGRASPALAIGGIKFPIVSLNIVATARIRGLERLVRSPPGHPPVRGSADGCFIEVHVESGKPEAGAIFFVSEAGAKAECSKLLIPAIRVPDGDFPFEPLLIARLGDRTRATGASPGGALYVSTALAKPGASRR